MEDKIKNEERIFYMPHFKNTIKNIDTIDINRRDWIELLLENLFCNNLFIDNNGNICSMFFCLNEEKNCIEFISEKSHIIKDGCMKPCRGRGYTKKWIEMQDTIEYLFNLPEDICREFLIYLVNVAYPNYINGRDNVAYNLLSNSAACQNRYL